MPTRPRLVRSIPFWGLVLVSIVLTAAGAKLVIDRLASMTSVLTDNTATGVDVYVGQSVAVLGTVLLGAGVIGILLALTVASIATLRPVAPAQVVEPIEWTEPAEAEAVAPTEAAVVSEPETLAAAVESEAVEPAAVEPEAVESAETATR